jgi:hypothetical protein
MATRKDYGRAAVYRSESEAFPERADVRLTPDEIVAMVSEVHRFHGDRGSLPRCEFTDKRQTSACAFSFQRRMRFPARGASPFLVLHEIAHVYTASDVGHGPAWRRRYLGLVLAMIGTAEAKALADAFERNGVSAQAAASAPAYRKRTRPNRRFRFEISRVDVSKAQAVSSGNVTTWHGIEWGPWEPITKDAPEFAGMTAHDINAMRNGTVWFRGSVRLPGAKHGDSMAKAKVRAVRVR